VVRLPKWGLFGHRVAYFPGAVRRLINPPWGLYVFLRLLDDLHFCSEPFDTFRLGTTLKLPCLQVTYAAAIHCCNFVFDWGKKLLFWPIDDGAFQIRVQPRHARCYSALGNIWNYYSYYQIEPHCELDSSVAVDVVGGVHELLKSRIAQNWCCGQQCHDLCTLRGISSSDKRWWSDFKLLIII